MTQTGDSKALVPAESGPLITLRPQAHHGVPAIVAAGGDHAAKRFLEFFAVTIDNPNIRAAYWRACKTFFAWCDGRGLAELHDIEPMHVAAYVRQLGENFEKPTVKQHLAAVRMLFHWLVIGHVVATNPAHSVRGPKHVVKRGKTPVLAADEARQLLDCIDTSTVVGLRDRALIALMVYSFARVGAAVAMRVEDYFATGKRWWIRLHEKGGKRHEMPAHHNLEAYLDAYIQAAGFLDEAKKMPALRTSARECWIPVAFPPPAACDEPFSVGFRAAKIAKDTQAFSCWPVDCVWNITQGPHLAGGNLRSRTRSRFADLRERATTGDRR